MSEKKQLKYFVTYDNSDRCLIIVPAEFATKLADYIESNWKPNLFVDEIVYRPCFYTLAWQSFEKVGIVQVHQERTDVDEMFLGTLATTVATSFFEYCVS